MCLFNQFEELSPLLEGSFSVIYSYLNFLTRIWAAGIICIMSKWLVQKAIKCSGYGVFCVWENMVDKRKSPVRGIVWGALEIDFSGG